MACSCKERPFAEPTSFVSFPVPGLTAVATRASALAAPDAANTQQVVHITASGDQILSSTSISAAGQGTVAITGHIGLISVDGKISVTATPNKITLTIELTQPLQFGPQTWEFDVSGSSMHLSSPPATAQLLAANVNFACILQCAGSSVLPILVQCLPSLLGGPPAFISCVVAQLGGNAGPIALCIDEVFDRVILPRRQGISCALPAVGAGPRLGEDGRMMIS